MKEYMTDMVRMGDGLPSLPQTTPSSVRTPLVWTDHTPHQHSTQTYTRHNTNISAQAVVSHLTSEHDGFEGGARVAHVRKTRTIEAVNKQSAHVLARATKSKFLEFGR